MPSATCAVAIDSALLHRRNVVMLQRCNRTDLIRRSCSVLGNVAWCVSYATYWRHGALLHVACGVHAYTPKHTCAMLQRSTLSGCWLACCSSPVACRLSYVARCIVLQHRLAHCRFDVALHIIAASSCRPVTRRQQSYTTHRVGLDGLAVGATDGAHAKWDSMLSGIPC